MGPVPPPDEDGEDETTETAASLAASSSSSSSEDEREHGGSRARRAGGKDEGMEMKLLRDGEGTDEDEELPSIFSPPPERDCAVNLKKKKKKQKAPNDKKMEPGGGKKPAGSAKPMKKGPASEPPLRAVGVHPHRREDGDVGEGEEESVDRHQLSYRPMRADWNALREKQHQRKREHDNNNDHNHRHHSHQPRLQAEVLRLGRPFWRCARAHPSVWLRTSSRKPRGSRAGKLRRSNDPCSG
jgi:hypothetical protein